MGNFYNYRGCPTHRFFAIVLLNTHDHNVSFGIDVISAYYFNCAILQTDQMSKVNLRGARSVVNLPYCTKVWKYVVRICNGGQRTNVAEEEDAMGAH